MNMPLAVVCPWTTLASIGGGGRGRLQALTSLRAVCISASEFFDLQTEWHVTGVLCGTGFTTRWISGVGSSALYSYRCRLI